jgi:hypothetical protein
MHRIRFTQVMPLLMGTECLLASAAFLYSKDFKFGLYWLFAGAINFTLAIL